MLRIAASVSRLHLSREGWFKCAVVLVSCTMIGGLAWASILFGNAGVPNHSTLPESIVSGAFVAILIGFVLINAFRLRDVGVSAWHQAWYLGLAYLFGLNAGPLAGISVAMFIGGAMFLLFFPGRGPRKGSVRPESLEGAA